MKLNKEIGSLEMNTKKFDESLEKIFKEIDNYDITELQLAKHKILNHIEKVKQEILLD